ncbi:hypothetical protein D3C71_1289450 [compost metagenome]
MASRGGFAQELPSARQPLLRSIFLVFGFEDPTMSTSETFTFDMGPCPCGKGQILKRVISQDNPWSDAIVSHSIECPACSRDWRVERRSIVLRSSETLFNSAFAAVKDARSALHELLKSIVEHQFSTFSAPTKKAEHAQLERLDLTHMSYRQYLEHKRKGGSISTAAAPLKNIAWLQAAAIQMNVEKQLEALFNANSQADQARAEASTKIVRINLA